MTRTTSNENTKPAKAATTRAPGTMRDALSASLGAETNAFKARLQKAEQALDQRAEQALDTPALPEATKRMPKPNLAIPNAAPQEIARVVRDAFTMPEDDYALIEKTQQRCLKNAVRLTKSEALRAGLQALAEMSDADLLAAVERLEKVRTGRPKASA